MPLVERSHLQPQVVFQHTAKIEGKSQTPLKAKLLSAAVLVLYTEHRERGRTVNREKKRSRSLKRGGEEGGRGGQYLYPS